MKDTGDAFYLARMRYDNRLRTILCGLFLTIVSPSMAETQNRLVTEQKNPATDSTILYNKPYFAFNIWKKPLSSEYTKMDSFLKHVLASPQSKIYLVGWADKIGTKEINDIFSKRRAETVKRYLVQNGVDASRILTEGRGVDKKASSNQEARRVDMTTTIAVAVAQKPDTLQATSPTTTTTNEPEICSTMCLYLSRFQTPVQEQRAPRAITEDVIVVKPIIALKTNLLYDLAITPNIEVEVPIGKRWSINAEYQLGWWNKKDNSFCWRICSGSVEGRYWFGNRENHNVLNGWFAGVFVSTGTYDLQLKKKTGYQGDFFATGISGGYVTPIARNLNLEFSLGAGYVNSNYRHYEVIDRELVDDGTVLYKNTVLPLKAKVSLSWMINRRIKKGGTK